MKRGTELELTVEKFADRGKSLAKVDGYVIFMAGAVPGDRVRVKVFKRKKSYAEAKVIDVLDPSPMRTDARCRYFGTCGGCKWQHVEYASQLEAKQLTVHDAFHHHRDFANVEVPLPIGAEEIYTYRNKMEFSFSTDRWLTPEEIATGAQFDTDFALGLHVPGNFFKVLDLQECHLQSTWSAGFVNAVRAYVKERNWEPWDIRNHTGYLRHLVIREGSLTGEVMVNLVTNGYDADRMKEMAAWVQQEAPEVTTFLNTINTGVAQTSYGERTECLFGPGVIHDKIGPYTFEIAPSAFFQTNTRQAETLYRVARDFADLQPDDVVYDLYCGAGTISLYLSDAVQRVVGVELVEEAVVNARANAHANGVDNCTFVSGDLMRMFTPDFVQEHGRPDVLVVDPPRAGMHKKVIQQIADLRPERFVYVSCNPRSQARDLDGLKDQYTIDRVQPVDLFPHTHHIENVIRLTARPQ